MLLNRIFYLYNQRISGLGTSAQGRHIAVLLETISRNYTLLQNLD